MEGDFTWLKERIERQKKVVKADVRFYFESELTKTQTKMEQN